MDCAAVGVSSSAVLTRAVASLCVWLWLQLSSAGWMVQGCIMFQVWLLSTSLE